MALFNSPGAGREPLGHIWFRPLRWRLLFVGAKPCVSGPLGCWRVSVHTHARNSRSQFAAAGPTSCRDAPRQPSQGREHCGSHARSPAALWRARDASVTSCRHEAGGLAP
eukprot:scaffold351_cov371-Prasinococcus_capsulatus_cf.AAC.12